MSREIKRVPLDFEWPLYRRWWGYLSPDKFDEYPCEKCESGGYSQTAMALFDKWYGNTAFYPEENGSTPISSHHPVLRERAARSVNDAPDYYGRELIGEAYAIDQQARRLAHHYNRSWSHHLNQADVEALLAGDRLADLVQVFTREHGWQYCLGGTAPTAAEVNEWSLTGFGHDTINAHLCVVARCQAAGVPYLCDLCHGDGSFQIYLGQREEAEQWQRTQPPAGDGWQAWETTSEGSPISPVFATAEELATWWSQPDREDRYAKDWMPYPAAYQFILVGYSAGSTASNGDGNVVSGAEFVGMADRAEIGGA